MSDTGLDAAQYSPGKGQRRWLSLLGAATWPDVLRRFLTARIALNATIVSPTVKAAAGALTRLGVWVDMRPVTRHSWHSGIT